MKHVAAAAIAAALTLGMAGAGTAQQTAATHTAAAPAHTAAMQTHAAGAARAHTAAAPTGRPAAQPRHATAGAPHDTRVTEAQARRTALATVRHGRVRSHELVREHGRLVYSFHLSAPGSRATRDVRVDAITGHIVPPAQETPAAAPHDAGKPHRR